MAKLNVKTIDARIAKIGTASHGHFAELKAIGIEVTLHASEHGDCQYMSKLFRAVSTNDQYAFRQFVNNVNKTHGQEHMVAGKPFMLFSFAREAKLGVHTGNQEDVGKAIFYLTPIGEGENAKPLQHARKLIRESINKADEAGLAQLQWVSAGQANRPDDWDFETKLATLLATAARRHATSKARLEQINKLIETPEKRVAIETEYAKGNFSEADAKRLANLQEKEKRAKELAKAENLPAPEAKADPAPVAAE